MLMQGWIGEGPQISLVARVRRIFWRAGIYVCVSKRSWLATAARAGQVLKKPLLWCVEEYCVVSSGMERLQILMAIMVSARGSFTSIKATKGIDILGCDICVVVWGQFGTTRESKVLQVIISKKTSMVLWHYSPLHNTKCSI